MTGSVVAGVMVQTPPASQPAPETLNAMVSRPALPLASVIAWRSDPRPVSLVFVTVNVAASSEAAQSASARQKRTRMTRSSFPQWAESIAGALCFRRGLLLRGPIRRAVLRALPDRHLRDPRPAESTGALEALGEVDGEVLRRGVASAEGGVLVDVGVVELPGD